MVSTPEYARIGSIDWSILKLMDITSTQIYIFEDIIAKGREYIENKKRKNRGED